MSIDHTFKIGGDETCDIYLNISGLDAGGHEVGSLSANIYAFDKRTGVSKFTCNLELSDLGNLYHHLEKYSIIKDVEVTNTGKFIEVDMDSEELISLLTVAQTDTLIPVLRNIINSRLSRSDLNTILGRRDSLNAFNEMLNNSENITEPTWQEFFMQNEWIFGYGLTYKFLRILQREAYVSGLDLDGSNSVISDFLLSDSRFTKLVELKTPDTSLFDNRRNRADAWRLSTALTDAVSQILSQKANWEIESTGINYNAAGDQIIEETFDVESILIIGRFSSISGTQREQQMKRKTFELYRRNLRCIEILTYDELFARAQHIVGE